MKGKERWNHCAHQGEGTTASTSTDGGRSSDHKEESEKFQTSSGKLADRDKGMCQLLESGAGGWYLSRTTKSLRRLLRLMPKTNMPPKSALGRNIVGLVVHSVLLFSADSENPLRTIWFVVGVMKESFGQSR